MTKDRAAVIEIAQMVQRMRAGLASHADLVRLAIEVAHVAGSAWPDGMTASNGRAKSALHCARARGRMGAEESSSKRRLTASIAFAAPVEVLTHLPEPRRISE